MNYVKIMNNDVRVSSQKMIAIIPRFMEYHISRNQQKLFFGIHWVWDSLKYLLPKICDVVVLSGYTVESKELLVRDQTETLLR